MIAGPTHDIAMTTFQLDQCCNDKKLARDCSNEGLVSCWCFPKKLMNATDPEVLIELLKTSNPLLTFDHRMAEDHTEFIPERHPGLVVISNGRGGNPQTMTSTIARKILRKFKGLFQDWHITSVNNSIVVLFPPGVEVLHVEDGRLISDGYVEYDLEEWATQFSIALSTNSQRGAALAPPQGECS